MRATGIVRRIDDLGRVVVPKEIRKTLRIREGDPLEIYTDREGEIILKKYSPISELSTFAEQYAQALASVTGYKVVIADRDQIIAVAGGLKKEIKGKRITGELDNVISGRKVLNTSKDKKSVQITEGEKYEELPQIVYPISCEGDMIGAVILLGKEGILFSDIETKLAGVAATFLGGQMEG